MPKTLKDDLISRMGKVVQLPRGRQFEKGHSIKFDQTSLSKSIDALKGAKVYQKPLSDKEVGKKPYQGSNLYEVFDSDGSFIEF